MKKKVLFVNGHLNVGGVEKSLIDVLKNFDYSKYDVDLVLFEDLGDYANEVPKVVNIRYYDLSQTYGPIKQCLIGNIRKRNWFALFLRFIFMLQKVIGSRALFFSKPLFKLPKKYDCAIAYRVGICTDFVAYVVDSKKKLTWWHHGTYDFPENLTRQLVKAYRIFDKIIAVSESTKRMLISNIQELENNFITIPNIINVEEIRQKANYELKYNFDNMYSITLLSIGRLSPEKGMINCVHACKKLVENGYSIKWYLIGEGSERGAIEKYIKDYHLENNLFLLGAISNPYPYLKNAFIYVHPSLVESLSITVLEALTLNIPVTVAKSMGPMEFIRDKENGLLVEPTSEGLFQGIVTLLKDDHLYTRLKKDHEDVLRNYSPVVVMNKIIDLIEAG